MQLKLDLEGWLNNHLENYFLSFKLLINYYEQKNNEYSSLYRWL